MHPAMLQVMIMTSGSPRIRYCVLMMLNLIGGQVYVLKPMFAVARRVYIDLQCQVIRPVSKY